MGWRGCAIIVDDPNNGKVCKKIAIRIAEDQNTGKIETEHRLMKPRRHSML